MSVQHIIHEGGIAGLLARVRKGEFTVDVGVLEGAGNETDADGKDAGVTLATVAAANNFGTISVGGNIPERDFFGHGLALTKDKRQRLNTINLANVVRGKQTIPKALGQLGAMAAGGIKEAIGTSKQWAKENAQSTKDQKGSDQPLKDTGNLEQAITWAESK